MEKVDILLPPNFHKSGVTKTREQAISDGDWLGGFHLWLVRTKPELSLIFQRRSYHKPTFPNQLDVSSAGHYQAGETVKNGLREVKEELGKDYDFLKLTYLGRKMFVDFDLKKRKLQTINDVFITIDNSSLASFKLQKEEVSSLLIIKIADLEKVFQQKAYSFKARGINQKGQEITQNIQKADFIQNWDSYQYKIAKLSKRFVKGEKNLIY